MTELDDDTIVRFSAYLEDELDSDERAAFEAELAADGSLRESFDEFKSTMQVLVGLGREQAPDDFTDRVQRRIRKRSRGRFFGDRMGSSQSRQVQLFIVFAILLLLGIVWVVTPERVDILWGEDGAPSVGSGEGVGSEDDAEPAPAPGPSGSNTESGASPSRTIATGAGETRYPPAQRMGLRYNYVVDEIPEGTYAYLEERYGADNVRSSGDAISLDVAPSEHEMLLEWLGGNAVITREDVPASGDESSVQVRLMTSEAAAIIGLGSDR